MNIGATREDVGLVACVDPCCISPGQSHNPWRRQTERLGEDQSFSSERCLWQFEVIVAQQWEVVSSCALKPLRTTSHSTLLHLYNLSHSNNRHKLLCSTPLVK